MNGRLKREHEGVRDAALDPNVVERAGGRFEGGNENTTPFISNSS